MALTTLMPTSTFTFRFNRRRSSARGLLWNEMRLAKPPLDVQMRSDVECERGVLVGKN